MSRSLVVFFALAGCTGGSDAPAPEPAPAPPPLDAATIELQPSGVYDPASGRHLDDDAPPAVVPRLPERPARAQRPIDLTLRSQPTGAMAAVDGVPLGPTPVYWSGDANGRVHEFTFVAPHYTVARYRFVPVTSGILYAHLDSVAGEEAPPAAGVPPIPLAVPGLAPPAPVPTVISPPPRSAPPPDAAPRVRPDAAEVDPLLGLPLPPAVDAAPPPPPGLGPSPD